MIGCEVEFWLALGLTSSTETYFFGRVPINSMLAFIIRTYETLGYGSFMSASVPTILRRWEQGGLVREPSSSLNPKKNKTFQIDLIYQTKSSNFLR